MTGLALTASSLVVGAGVPTALAAPTTAAPSAVEPGRGPSTAKSVDPVTRAKVARAAAAAPAVGTPIAMPTSYPYQPSLRIYRPNADDAAHTAALLGHPDLAPKLMDLMAVSDRISVQVVGQSTEGRDLYLVTVTAPETEAETAQQAQWKGLIKNDPVAAAADPDLAARYKTPVWISNNIHGNEWEGTDAAMQYIEYLATAPIAEVRSVLANNRLYFSPSLNPDGRTNATRATALGLDPNRDMITNTTPETRSFIRTAQAIQPIYAADFHGYTNVLQMEPCGPPHGSNYEYDLTMPHNYALALKVEKDVVDAAIPGNTYLNTTTGRVVTANTGPETAHIKIPYRDTPDGWDDFPPIFTAQYAAFYGAASATVELPLTRGAAGGRQTPERAKVNTAVAYQTMQSIVGYMNVATNAREMIGNQIEAFRRGLSGEPKRTLTVDDVSSVPGPTQWRGLWDVADNQEPVTLPRAYVVPVGEGQRSASDARRLVEQLLQHDIEVGRLVSAATVGGTTYPAGSYVVDMDQPLRGLANALLDLGEDISAKVPSMYDISAWSLGYTWGATVDKVGLVGEAPLGDVLPISEVPAVALPGASDGFLSFDVAGVPDYQLLNALLEDGVKVSMLEDGSVVVDGAGRSTALAAAQELGVELDEASTDDLAALDDEDTKPLDDLTIGYVGTQDDRLSLEQLGFDDIAPLSVATLNATPTALDAVDVLWVASSFAPAAGTAARTAVEGFLARGGALLGRTNQAFNAAVSFGLLSGTVTSGNGSGNGIVAVDTPEGSVLEPYAQDTSFIYPAYSFSGLGAGTKIEQTYDATKPFLAGHWRGTTPTNGPAQAAGQASVVSSENPTTGAKALVFGTSVFFRTHPKGGLSQAARALFWAGPEGDELVAPEPTPPAPTPPLPPVPTPPTPTDPTPTDPTPPTPTDPTPEPVTTDLTVAPVAPVAYPGVASVTVSVGAAEGAAEGTIDLMVGDRVVASAPTSGGRATLRVPGLRPGTTTAVAVFTPTEETYASSSSTVRIVVRKAESDVSISAPTVGGVEDGAAPVTVRLVLRLPGLAPVGTIVLKDFGVVKRVVRLTAADDGRKVVTLRLGKGKHSLLARLRGSALVAPSTDRVTFRVR
ncbi:M14 family metallopeptidase [Nocardioides sp. SOB77]|uniref:M14 family metallopeptidase n=1 Tax=Nocardioides oceani TaxID=3058369 RepID=A0ABT8FFT6_9ACTN|nr:M14 family metallopeptidase [Nocardioides oceani]MDN4173267.1 M14 family metallopeptidase [Nocardioides oceani]